FSLLLRFFVLRLRPPPRSPLFPYTTLFRSALVQRRAPERGWVVCRCRTKGCGRRSPHSRSPLGAFPKLERLTLTRRGAMPRRDEDRKSTRLNSSHVEISYAVFCLKKKKK